MNNKLRKIAAVLLVLSGLSGCVGARAGKAVFAQKSARLLGIAGASIAAFTVVWPYIIHPLLFEGEKSFKETSEPGYDFRRIKRVAILTPFYEIKRFDFAEAQGNVEIVRRALSSSVKTEFFLIHLPEGMRYQEVEKDLQEKDLRFLLDKLKVPKQADAIILGSMDEEDTYMVNFRGYGFSLTLKLRMFDRTGKIIWEAENTRRGGLHEVGGSVAARLGESYAKTLERKQ
ncbi:MAG: hypothetical protein ACE5GM_00765 [bacterium]